MMAGELTHRGFALNRNIPGFIGYCSVCQRYAPLDWWEAPTMSGRRGGEVVVCARCGSLDQRDERFVRSYPVIDVAKRRTHDREARARRGTRLTAVRNTRAAHRDYKPATGGPHSGQPGPKVRGRGGERTGLTKV